MAHQNLVPNALVKAFAVTLSAALCALFFFIILQPLAAQSPSLQPAFDWSIPERFGLDTDEDGLIDYYTTADAISPESWTIAVDACTSTAGNQNITLYGWSFPDIPEVPMTSSESCATTLQVGELGTYTITLTIYAENNTEASITQTVTVKDWLIVSMGDSYAAGEGAPDKNATLLNPSATWQNEAYHRSAFAAPAVAARQIEESDAKSSVTFVHLARSGARLIHEDPTKTDLNISAQITEAVTLLGTREIDALLLSIGGNDAGFSRLVQTCMTIEPCAEDDFTVEEGGLSEQICAQVEEILSFIPGIGEQCRQGASGAEEEIQEFTEAYTKSAAALFGELTAPIPDRYDQLAVDLSALTISEGGTYITEYADLTRQDSGALCPHTNAANNLPGISEAEYEWVDQDVLPQMNGLVQAAATRNGWHYIGGIANGYATHGYCADDNWIVRLTESVTTQFDLSGTLHPNKDGYAFTADIIAAQLQADLLRSSNAIYLPTAFR